MVALTSQVLRWMVFDGLDFFVVLGDKEKCIIELTFRRQFLDVRG